MKRFFIGLLLGVLLTLPVSYCFFFKYKIKVPIKEITLDECPVNQPKYITDLPKEYFDINLLESYEGSLNTNWVIIGDLPTEDITLTGFSNEEIDVKAIPSPFPGSGPEEELSDVDGDGIKERILTQSVAMTHSPHRIDIVKKNKVIFTVQAANIGFMASPSNNGFYINSRVDDQEGCCFQGYKITRFIYKDGKFKPVWEQKNHYLKIKDNQ